MRNNNVNINYRTPRAARSNTGTHFFSEHASRHPALHDVLFLEYKDEIVICAKGMELVLDLEAKIPVQVPIRLPNHIEQEYPIIDLDSVELEDPL